MIKWPGTAISCSLLLLACRAYLLQYVLEYNKLYAEEFIKVKKTGIKQIIGESPLNVRAHTFDKQFDGKDYLHSKKYFECMNTLCCFKKVKVDFNNPYVSEEEYYSEYIIDKIV